LIRNFKENDLYYRITKAESKYSEVPFITSVKPGNPLYEELKSNSSSKPILLSGTIDLVFKEADGWVVVDYKTDRPQNKKDYPRLIEVYQKQIDIYRQVWQEISGEKVKKAVYILLINDPVKRFTRHVGKGIIHNVPAKIQKRDIMLIR